MPRRLLAILNLILQFIDHLRRNCLVFVVSFIMDVLKNRGDIFVIINIDVWMTMSCDLRNKIASQKSTVPWSLEKALRQRSKRECKGFFKETSV